MPRTHEVQADVGVHIRDRAFVLPSEAEAYVDRLWDESLAQQYVDGTIFAVTSYSSTRIEGAWIPYRWLAAKRHDSSLDYTIHVLAVSGILIHQGHVLVGRRASNVLQYPGCWELVPSGGVSPSCLDNGGVDFLRQLLQELEEETNVTQWSVADSRPVLLVDDGSVLDIAVRVDLKERPAIPTRSEEYDELRWLSVLDAHALLLSGPAVPASALLLQHERTEFVRGV